MLFVITLFRRSSELTRREVSELPKTPPGSREEKASSPRTGQDVVKRLFTWDRDAQWSVLFWVTVIILTYLLVPVGQRQGVDYQPGDIAHRDIKAAQSALVEDEASTQARKLEAEASVLAVYDFDRRQDFEIIQKIRAFFPKMRDLFARLEVEEEELRQRWKKASRTERPQIDDEIRLFWQQADQAKLVPISEFIDTMALEITPEQVEPLLKDRFSERSENVLADSFQPVLGMGIVSNRETLLRERGKGVSVRTLDTVSEELALDDFSSILSLEAARLLVKKTISTQSWSRGEAPLRDLLGALAQDFVRPNFTFNRSETEERRKKAVQETKSVYLQVKRGEIIVRAGDPLTDEQILKIRGLNKSVPSDGRITLVLGTFLLIAIILFAFYRVLITIQPGASDDTLRLVMLVVIIVLQVVLIKGFMAVFQAMTLTYPGIKLSVLSLAVPFAAGAMLTATLFPINVGLVVAGLTSIFAAVLNEWSMTTFIYSFIGGIVASFSVLHCRQRSSLIKAGFAVGGVNAVLALVSNLEGGTLFTTTTFSQIFFAVGGGIGVALVASLALPLLESGFNVATDMKLMELANLNQPVLKEMIIRTPGSYHHSVMVGSLAEAAAEEIGANPLLARVAASYHDIGKINKPEYFVENQETRANRHEKLSPNMSALILTAHVKDGVELAREHRLPRRIVDIIRQHHGTRLMTFFYSKAKEMEGPSSQTVEKENFRYQGPKPQTREAALIMLGDAVEAASKVLTDPTPARIRGLVQKIINEIFIDGQLDESNLTLRDLHQIAKSFTRTITGIFHHRIDYPDLQATGEEKKGKGTNDSDPDPGSPGQTVPEESGKPGDRNIKRLGQD